MRCHPIFGTHSKNKNTGSNPKHSANGYGYISVMYSSRPAHVQNVPLHHADGPVQPHNSVVSESSYCAGSAHTKLKSTGVGSCDR